MPDRLLLQDIIQSKLNLNKLLDHVRLAICVTDPCAEDNPIIYANPAFYELTGYRGEDVLGRNCRFLQGPKTTEESLDDLRDAITTGEIRTVDIVNYRKDGTEFLNALQIGPIYDDAGEIVLFFGSQVDITDKVELQKQVADLEMNELLHRLRNIVNVMSVVIQMTAKETTDKEELIPKIIDRLHALSSAHFKTFGRASEDQANLIDLADTVLEAYAPAGRKQFTIDGDAIFISPQLTTPIVLALHELATNAVKHGALSCEKGVVEVSWTMSQSGGSDQLDILWEEKFGPEVHEPTRASGSEMIQKILNSANGTLTYDWKKDGLIARISCLSE